MQACFSMRSFLKKFQSYGTQIQSRNMNHENVDIFPIGWWKFLVSFQKRIKGDESTGCLKKIVRRLIEY